MILKLAFTDQCLLTIVTFDSLKEHGLVFKLEFFLTLVTKFSLIFLA